MSKPEHNWRKMENRFNNNAKENTIADGNLTQKKKNVPFLCVKPSTTFTDNLKPSKNEEKMRRNSFEELLTLMLTPTGSGCSAVSQKGKENSLLKSSKGSVNPRKEVKSTLRSDSFDLMLKSLLNPTDGAQSINKSCLSSQGADTKPKDLTFDEMMNKLLTPELHTPIKQKNILGSCLFKHSAINNSLESRKNTQISLNTSKEENRRTSYAKTTNDRLSQQSASTYDDADVSFEQLLSPIFSPEPKSQRNDLAVKGNKMQQELQPPQTSEVKFLDNCEELSQRSCQSSSKPRKRSYDCLLETDLGKTDSEQSKLFVADASFDQIQTLTLDLESQKGERNCLTKESCCREISTQTCSEELFFPMSIPTLPNYCGDDSIRVPFIYSQNIIDKSLNESTAVNESTAAAVSKICDEKQPVDRVKHILDILSFDFSILPNGRKVFNISQIGTDKWLQSAFAVAKKKRKVNKKEKIDYVDLYEEQNTSQMYIDYLTRLDIKRYLQGKTRICEIKKIDGRPMIECDKIEARRVYFWNPVEDEPISSQNRRLRQKIDQICTNEDFVSSDCVLEKIDKTKICIKIHSIIARLYDVFESNQMPNLMLRRRRDSKSCIFKNGRLQYAPLQRKLLKKIPFNLQSKFSFCRLLYVMGKVYSMLQNKNKLTKREIFYQTKYLVKTQRAIDDSVDEVTCLLGIGPWHLNILSQKGLVYGDLKLFWGSGEVTNCNTPGTLIPNDLEDLVKVETNAFFILVVEKESIFCKLLEEDLPNKLARPFILLTGKGVPSINTRLFLNKISRMMALPVFILVDADVYGVKIMLTYRFGSINNCHLVDDLSVPKARWLGVFPSEISVYNMKHQELTMRDKSMVSSLLQCICMQDHPKIAAELELLLALDRKASIEGLIKNNTFLSESYLPMKFFKQDFV